MSSYRTLSTPLHHHRRHHHFALPSCDPTTQRLILVLSFTSSSCFYLFMYLCVLCMSLDAVISSLQLCNYYVTLNILTGYLKLWDLEVYCYKLRLFSNFTLQFFVLPVLLFSVVCVCFLFGLPALVTYEIFPYCFYLGFAHTLLRFP